MFCTNHFLWIEDFDGRDPVATAKTVWGNLLNYDTISDKYGMKDMIEKQGIFLELTFIRAMQFIRDPEKLAQIDYILLDIDLPIEQGQLADLDDILKRYENSREKLQELAGYEIYLELVINHGFPKNRIIFCSNHGNRLKSIETAFLQARIPLDYPIYDKSGRTQNIQHWIKQRCEPQTDYEILRKGIFMGCQQVLDDISTQPDNIQFCEFIKNPNSNDIQLEIQDYLKTLQSLLPIRKSETKKFKLFIRTLTHEWDEKANVDKIKNNKVKYTFGQIMKCVRNWTTHTKELDNLSEKQLAFLFMIAMRAMFKLPATVQNYEKLLLKLYGDTQSLPAPESIKGFLHQSYKNVLIHYNSLLQQNRKLAKPAESISLDKINFIALVRTMQLHDKTNSQSLDYKIILYQMFWHGLSPITLQNPQYRDEALKLIFECDYNFELHDYECTHPDNFIYTLACAIYPNRA